jgi:hypothetical protein
MSLSKLAIPFGLSLSKLFDKLRANRSTGTMPSPSS